MEAKRELVRHCLLYEYRLGHSAAVAARNIRSAEGEDAVSDATARRWIERFRNNNYDLKDYPRSGRPVEIDVDRLNEIIERDPRISSRCLADLNCSHTQVLEYLHQLQKVFKLGTWISHELTVTQLNQRVNICMNILSGWI